MDLSGCATLQYTEYFELNNCWNGRPWRSDSKMFLNQRPHLWGGLHFMGGSGPTFYTKYLSSVVTFTPKSNSISLGV